MKLATRTFKRDDWYITCPFGERINPVTHKKDFHSGCDYGTDKENWKQYALESGTVTRVGYNAKGYGHYMDIQYPRPRFSKSRPNPHRCRRWKQASRAPRSGKACQFAVTRYCNRRGQRPRHALDPRTRRHLCRIFARRTRSDGGECARHSLLGYGMRRCS